MAALRQEPDFSAEVETDRTGVQSESPAAGRLARILVGPGSTIFLGATLGVVQTRP